MTGRRLLEKCELLCSAAVAVASVLSLWSAANLIALPYQLNYEEGNELNAALRIVQGATPYAPPGESLYVFNPYGPVPYHLWGLLVKWFGVSFAYPRLLVLLSALLISLLLSLLLRHWTGSWSLGLSFGFLYLALPVTRQWLPLLRVDLIGIAFTLGGLYVFTVFPRRWYVGIPLFVAAIFCKYTLLAAPTACLVFLLLHKEWRRATWFATSIGLLAVLLFAWMQRATQGWFGFHMFWTHQDPIAPSHLWAVSAMLLIHLPLIIPAILLALHELSNRAESLPLIYWGVCCLTTLTVLKAGSDLNHMLEWVAALCLCAGFGYHWLRTQPSGAPTAALISAMLAAFVLLMGLALTWRAGQLSEYADCSQVYDYVKNHPGNRILSGNVGAVVMAGKPVFFSNPFVYGFLVKSSILSDAGLSNLVRARYFHVILLDENVEHLKEKAMDPSSPDSIWPTSFVDALEENYRPVRQFICKEANFAFEPSPR